MHKIPTELYGIQLYKNCSEENLLYILAYVVDKCNYNCRYCYNNSPRSSQFIGLTQLYNYIVFVKQRYPDKYVQLELIGGEPTLHPDLYEFCHKIADIPNTLIKIFTNLSVDVEYYKKLLDLNNVVLIASWHSLREDRLNTKYLNALNSLLVDYKQQIEVRVMYEPFNTDRALSVANQLVDKSQHDIFDLSLVFNPKNENSELFNYSDQQMEEFEKFHKLHQVRTNRKEFYIKYDDNTSELKTFNEMFCNKSYSFKRWLCNAGKNSLFVNYDGNVYPCVEYSYNINNAIFNIYNVESYLNYKFKPIFCKLDYCTCDWDIKKKKVF